MATSLAREFTEVRYPKQAPGRQRFQSSQFRDVLASCHDQHDHDWPNAATEHVKCLTKTTDEQSRQVRVLLGASKWDNVDLQCEFND
jgi:hypothetical protein